MEKSSAISRLMLRIRHLLPCPDFRRDVIIGRNISLLFQELSYIQVKSRIIYQGLPHPVSISQYLPCISSCSKRWYPNVAAQAQNPYRPSSLKCLTRVPPSAAIKSPPKKRNSANSSIFFQRAHQSAGMQISTRLSYNQVILHNSKFLNQS